MDSWDDDGVALVVDPARGALRQVTDWPDFSHLEKAKKVVSVLPGGEWRAHWNEEGAGGAPLAEPVLAWLISSDGKATPITVPAPRALAGASA